MLLLLAALCLLQSLVACYLLTLRHAVLLVSLVYVQDHACRFRWNFNFWIEVLVVNRLIVRVVEISLLAHRRLLYDFDSGFEGFALEITLRADDVLVLRLNQLF